MWLSVLDVTGVLPLSALCSTGSRGEVLKGPGGLASPRPAQPRRINLCADATLQCFITEFEGKHHCVVSPERWEDVIVA